MSATSKKRMLGIVWALAVVAILMVFARGEDSYAARSKALQEATPYCSKVQAKVIENLAKPVQRLTRRGPKEEKVEHTHYQFVLEGATVDSVIAGHDEPGTSCELWADSRPPHDAYRRPPAEELQALTQNHYGTMLINDVFFISFLSFFLMWLSSVWIGPSTTQA